MKHRSALHKHIQTNIVARIIYRIVCLILLTIGVAGSYVSIEQLQFTKKYLQRNSTAVATVRTVSQTADPLYPESDICRISYIFKVDNQKYISSSTNSLVASMKNCHLRPGDEIKVRYAEDDPTNNAYGDTTLERNQSLALGILATATSAIALGIGFIGLVAIHKAMASEQSSEVRTTKNYRRKPQMGQDQ